jgi:hypothetical protein
MIEYETFTYLALQKTGSTFIINFLKRFCSEDRRWAKKHSPVPPDRYSPEKLYIISVRDPLDQYLSLYSFGVAGRGGLHRRVNRNSGESHYDGTDRGFRRWLRLVLQPENAHVLDREYAEFQGGELAQIVGYQSFRYLRLACLRLDSAADKEALRQSFAQSNIVGFVIRNERLNADLATLVRTRLRHSISDLDAALAYLENAQRINASKRIDQYGETFRLREGLRKQVQQREWLLHELFGY